MQRLKNKVALVTGAARGIGAAIAARFIDEGAKVVIADIVEEEGRMMAAQLGSAAMFLPLDVTDRVQWQSAFDETAAAFGKIDCLVNNAGIIKFARLDDLAAEDMVRILQVNLLGTMYGTQLVIPFLEKAGGGTIINMSSADGISGANALSAYCASKFGVRGFTKAAALELGPRGIRVNSIHPGGIMTAMANPTDLPREIYDRGYWIYPAQRSGHPSDIGAAAAYLASDDARYCYGTELAVDGGLTAGHYYMSMPGAPCDPNNKG